MNGELDSYINSQESTEFLIPLVLFKNRRISSFEVIVKYLKEIHGKRYSEIARLLNRDQRTIWATYKNSKQKHPKEFSPLPEGIQIPLSIFKERKISVLELIVDHLKSEHSLRLKDIAHSLNRSDSTIRTIHTRLKKKREGIKGVKKRDELSYFG